MNSVSDMFKVVWLIYFHKLSTDSVPQHGLCPTSTDTWCGFNKAKLFGETYSHKHSLPKPVVAAVAEWYGHRIVAGFVTSSSPVPLKTRRVGQRCTLNLSRAEVSSRWCGS
ncbi:uncharacterized protein TNCV_2174231 [Trichonephila clavipes]|nr:uncharacterized protein TNCV_2174231 [Trichonephila clavipes]